MPVQPISQDPIPPPSENSVYPTHQFAQLNIDTGIEEEPAGSKGKVHASSVRTSQPNGRLAAKISGETAVGASSIRASNSRGRLVAKIREDTAVGVSSNPDDRLAAKMRVETAMGASSVRPSNPGDRQIRRAASPVLSDEKVTRHNVDSACAARTSLPPSPLDDSGVEVNNTLKIIFVGMAFAGKTTVIRRLRDGEGAEMPKREERTIGVDHYEWDPAAEATANAAADNGVISCCDTTIVQEGNVSMGGSKPVHVKFSVWDFAGQDIYHVRSKILLGEYFSPLLVLQVP